jgi:hypothetical protein
LYGLYYLQSFDIEGKIPSRLWTGLEKTREDSEEHGTSSKVAEQFEKGFQAAFREHLI